MQRNDNILLLMAFGIVFVVLGHKGGIGLFSDWFPYYSFHMPLFMFIAGYLFKEKYIDNVKDYIIKKFRHLMVPYYMWNLFYGLMVVVLKYFDVVKFGIKFDAYNFFVMPFVHGHQFSLNVAMWFVPQLFAIQVIYILFRKLKSKLKFSINDWLALVVFLAFGLVSIWLVNHGYVTNHWRRFLFRTLFFLPFFHFGYLYRTRLELKDKLDSLIYFAIIFVIQFALLKAYGNISFNAIVDHYPSKIILPYITSMTGIMFWLRISKILAPLLTKSRYIQYLGENTWTVMAHHQFVFFLINFGIFSLLPYLNLRGFSIDKFQHNAWYGYHPAKWQFLIFYSAAGIILPLLGKYLYDRYQAKRKENTVALVQDEQVALKVK